jgi:uroporphyrinogen decarboxylase
MKPRDRLRIALSHQEPDRVPIDLGAIVAGVTTGANKNLKPYLGIQSDDPVTDRVQQLAKPSEPLLERLHVDTRYLFINAPSDWQDIELPDDTYEDEFGVRRKAAYRSDGHLLYYDFVGKPPLSDITTVTELANYKWPDPHDSARYDGVEAAARELFQTSDYGVIVNLIGSIFEFSWYLRGYVNFMQDLILNPRLAEALLDGMLEFQCALMDELLTRVGDYVSVVMTGSDLGTQHGPAISPDIYRAIVWPRYKKLWDLIKSKTKAKIFYHSCGSIIPFIPLLIEGGVDAIHPVQPKANQMGDRKWLKREFGTDITFWGGFDQQEILPFGAPAQVREEARRLLDDFMPGGGFVFAAGHNIQADVPPENVLALFDTVIEHGAY